MLSKERCGRSHKPSCFIPTTLKVAAVRSIACVVYFTVPAAVETALGGAFSLQSYFYFAAPHIIWLGVALALRFSTVSFHAGFIAANVSLLALFWQFQCCLDNSNGLGWLLYWPAAALLMVVGVGLELTARLGAGNADQ